MKCLLGSECDADATINGILCRSLIGYGSKVTSVSKSFHMEHQSDYVQLVETNHLNISVEGAGGQNLVGMEKK